MIRKRLFLLKVYKAHNQLLYLFFSISNACTAEVSSKTRKFVHETRYVIGVRFLGRCDKVLNDVNMLRYKNGYRLAAIAIIQTINYSKKRLSKPSPYMLKGYELT